MKEEVKEVKIVAPDGYEIDRAHSTFDKIIFKKKEVERWIDKDFKKVNGYFIDDRNKISPLRDFPYNNESSYDIFATEKQAKSALTMARISIIMANDERFGGAITDEEWADPSILKFIITRARNHILFKDGIYCTYNFLAFHNKKQRDLFFEENERLVKDYLMID